MPIDRPPQVLVVVDNSPRASWHEAVIAALRREAVDVTVSADAGPGLDAGLKPCATVIVDLIGRPISANPALGIWRYGFGDGAGSANGARGTLARLYRLDRDNARGAVLREGWFRGASDDAPGTEDVGACVAGWCGLAVREEFIDSANRSSPPIVSTQGCDSPLPPSLAIGTLASLRETVSRWRRRERWAIGIVPASIGAILERGELPSPHWLDGVPRDRYFADPFPLEASGDQVTLLAEEYHYREGRGRIVRIQVGRDGCIRDRRVVIDAPHHLAYPFVLSDGTATYCVPEAAATGQTYAFPLESAGDAATTLLEDFPAVDPTIVQHNGRWWMFCTARGDANQTDLHLFEADRWRGPWRPHPLNPVKSDARSSRPAGALFMHRDTLFRPAQDCSRRYGGAVAINRIVELTSTRFREETVCTLTPSPSWPWPDGMHTLNAIGDVVVIDALRVER